MRALVVFVLVAAGAGCSSSVPGGADGPSGMAGMAGADAAAGAAGTPASAGAGGGSVGGAAGQGDGSADGGPFCSQLLGDCAHLTVNLTKSNASYCKLSDGIAAECQACGPVDGGLCILIPGVVQGTRETYVDVLNVDVATRLVYDTTGTLVAALGYSFNSGKWTCMFGPSDFDPTEAMATPVATVPASQALRDMCDARADGGADGS